MRQISCLILLLLTACVGNSKEQHFWSDNGKVKVLSTIGMIDDLVREIGGEYVDAIALVKGEMDPHSYELVKGDDEKFCHANLIFFNGLGLEHSVSMRENLEKNPKAVSVGEEILKDDPSLILRIDEQFDPHIWMDITLWMRTIRTIVNRLCSIDPVHAREYTIAGERLYGKLEEADRVVYQTLQAIPADRRYLVTSHDAFHYFARRYLAQPSEVDWRARCAAPEGLAPDAQLSVADIYNIINHVETYGVFVLFPESNLSRDALKKIMKASRERGVPIVLAEQPLYGDAMGRSSNYLEMITHNVEVISKELMRDE